MIMLLPAHLVVLRSCNQFCWESQANFVASNDHHGLRQLRVTPHVLVVVLKRLTTLVGATLPLIWVGYFDVH